MLKWSCDAISWVSSALVVATAAVLPPPLTAVVVSVELAFAALSAYRIAAHDSDLAPEGSLSDGLRLFARLLDPKEGHARLIKSCRFLSEWFLGADPSKLGARNLGDFLAYTLFNARPGLGSAAGGTQLDDLLLQFTTAAGLDLTAAAAADEDDGHPDPARFMAHLQDPLRVSYRPLIFYLLMETIAWSAHLRLLRYGFRHAKSTNIATFFESVAFPAAVAAPDGSSSSSGGPVPPAATAAAGDDASLNLSGMEEQQQIAEDGEVPIIFLHGIGAGLAPYVGFMRRLAATGGAGGTRRKLYGVQYKHVSMRLTKAIPSAPELADEVLAFMDERGIAKATIVAHSYGTLVASSLVKRFGTRVASAVLVDPVCFALFLPNLVKNALYHHVDKVPVPFSLQRIMSVRSLLKGVVVRDFHCAVAMCRKMSWGDVNLWPSEMPHNTTIVLSGRDNLVPVQEVREILETTRVEQRGGFEVMYQPNHGHGAFLLDLDWQRQIVARVAAAAPPVAAATVAALPRRVLPAAAATAAVPTGRRRAAPASRPPLPAPRDAVPAVPQWLLEMEASGVARGGIGAQRPAARAPPRAAGLASCQRVAGQWMNGVVTAGPPTPPAVVVTAADVAACRSAPVVTARRWLKHLPAVVRRPIAVVARATTLRRM